MRKPRRAFFEHLKHVVIDENGCWLWPGTIDPKGYGVTSLSGERWWAHRASYQHYYGAPPDGLVICHKCDVRSCVNPAHLFAGTIADNQRDMKLKGRAARGEKSRSAKLTEDAVRLIRSDERPGWLLAEVHGVSQATISEVRSRKVWAHVI